MHVILMFSFLNSWTNSDSLLIDGTWYNESKNLSVLVETTDHGIRVKRADQDLWYFYDQIRPNQYRDESGNTYYFGESSLEWEHHSGTKQIRFTRTEPNKQLAQGPSKSDLPNLIVGKWINESSGQRISVKSREHGIVVQANDSDWVFFRESESTSFIDVKGNYYMFREGSLSYHSQSGDFFMRFVHASK